MRLARNISLILVVLFLLAVVTSCQSKQPAEQPPAQAPEQKQAVDTAPITATYLSGGQGGTWHIISEGISESIRKSYPGSSITVVPGNSIGNITQVSEGKADVGYCFLNHARAALDGKEPFTKQMPNIRLLASTHSTVAQFFILDKFGIKSFKEWKEKKAPIRISVHNRGSGNEEYSKQLLGEYGITYADIESWGGKVLFVAEAESIRLIKDGQLDGFFAGGAPPNANIVDLSMTHKPVFLKIEDDVLNAMATKYGYAPAVVPANAYNFNPETYKTFAASVVIVGSEDMPETTAYKFVKAMDENKDYLATVHVSVKQHMIDKTNGIIAGIEKLAPLHPGAEKYYKEKGIIK